MADDRTRDDDGHEWVAIATYSMSKDEAQASITEVVNLDDNPVELVGPVCYRCEGSLEDAGGTPCPGDPEEG